MYLRIFLIFLFCMTLLSSNCSSESLFTPIDRFYEKHPELKHNYKEFNPTSYYDLKLKVAEVYASKMRIIETITEKFGDYPDSVEYLTKREEFEKQQYENIIQELDKIDKSITTSDYFYHFEFEDSRFKESGLLILNDGEIKLREVSVRVFKNKK